MPSGSPSGCSPGVRHLPGSSPAVVRSLLIRPVCESLGYADFQGLYNPGCLANLNASSPMYTDLSVDNPFNRQWSWLTCNEP